MAKDKKVAESSQIYSLWLFRGNTKFEKFCLWKQGDFNTNFHNSTYINLVSKKYNFKKIASFVT